MSIKLCKFILFLLFINGFIFPIYNAHAADVEVVWTDLVGVTASGNDLTKTAGTGWGNSGAASTRSYSGDFGVQFTASQTNTYRLCGLSDTNVNANYNTIDYAIYPLNNGTVAVHENGVSKGTFGAYQIGDVFKVNRTGTTITYLKNDSVFYTSTVSSSGNLLVDTALYTSGAKINDVRFYGVSATEPAPVVDLAGDIQNGQVSLTWTAPWDNGSAITEYEIQYGTVASGAFASTYTDDAVPGATITGLTNGTEYQFRVIAKNAIGNGPVSNVYKRTPNTVVEVVWTDLVGVSASGNDITKTGANSWGTGGAASSLTQTGSFYMEFSAGSTTYNARAIGLSSTNADANYTSIGFAIYFYSTADVRVYESGTYKGSFTTYTDTDKFQIERTGTTIKYKKNGTTFYTSAASSSGNLLVDAALYYTTSSWTDVKFVGVSPTVPGAVTDLTQDYGDQQVAFNWSVPSTNGSAITEYEVQYGTVASGAFASTFTDDATPGATITGLTNGTPYQFRVVAKNSLGTGPASNVVQVVPRHTVDVSWADLVGVTANGNDLTKTAVDGWGNAGAASNALYENDVAVMFTVSSATNYVTAGLSDTNANAYYSSIDYAVLLDDSVKILKVYENGYYRYAGPSFAFNDVISVEKTGTTVVYKKNGATFYTSATASNTTLLVDSALYYVNTTLKDVRVDGQVDSSGSNPVQLNMGDSVEEVISPATDIDVYEFTGATGDKLYVPFSGFNGVSGYAPKIQLLDSTSTVLTGTYTTDADVLEYTLANTGTFSLKVTDNTQMYSGSYSFTLQRKNNPVGAVNINFGYQGTYPIDPRSDIDVYKFSALNGDHIKINYNAYATAPAVFDPAAALYTVDGTLLDESSADVTGTLGAAITASGDYYIWMTEREGTAEGYYTVQLEENLVDDISVSDMFFDPTNAETTTIYYTLDRDADVTLHLYKTNFDYYGVYYVTYYTTLFTDVPKSVGAHTYVWDGKNTAGNIVPTDVYTYVLVAEGATRTDTYSPVYVYGVVDMENLSITPTTFDPYKGETATLSYDLVSPAWVSIRIGIYGQHVHKRSLITKEPRDLLNNTEIWNGRGDNNEIVAGSTTYKGAGFTQILPENAIVVQNNTGAGINEVLAEPYAFYPIYGEAAEITYALAEDADVTLRIKNTSGQTIITLVDDAATTAGTHTVEWDGRDELNKVIATQGNYQIEVEITQGSTTIKRVGNITVFR